MKEIMIFRDLRNDIVKTYEEVCEDYKESVNADLPIPEDEMKRIIMLQLKKNGGHLELIQDNVMEWCNRFSNFNEVERYLSMTECETSVKTIYEGILHNDGEIICSLKENLAQADRDAEADQLLKQLNQFIKKK